ncbi:CDP-alcohol phosphatidyltransferase family protein [uncultured Sphingomonas sp.]|uniref:CDP-alcohol phosphatidyltransferase family protein n=1 Tax=uncultured Sphingomonas sp. TaxID=158754 RepID=UPI0035CC0524
MTTPPPDGSRDRRIEDPSNRLLIHPLAQTLVPWAIRWRIPANAVSLGGLALGIGAAACFAHWTQAGLVVLGFALALGWLVADGLDGKVARATGTASALGRFLDGVCDHLIFILIYVAIACTIGTTQGWTLAVIAGAAHAVQASLYEGERYRFHRRLRGQALVASPVPSPNPLVRGYDALAGSIDRLGRPFEAALAAARDPAGFGTAYGLLAVAPMRLMILLSANTRVLAIALACLLGSPALFWWFEIVPLTAVAIGGMVWHRRVEQHFTSRSRLQVSDRPSLDRIGTA